MRPSSSVFVLLALAGPAVAQTDSSALRQAVTVEAIRAHQSALADIAAANGGNRDAGAPGYMASVAYVEEKLQGAGYQVTVQPFHFLIFEETAPPEMARVAPDARSYVHGTDFLTVRYSGAGTVEGVVVPTTDVVIPPTPEPSSTSGCEPEDFPPAPAEAAVALVQRGTCTYQAKVDNAAAAGYAAVVIFNEGQPGRQEVIQGTLTGPVTIPAVTASFAVGEELFGLAQAGEARLRLAVRDGDGGGADRERRRRDRERQRRQRGGGRGASRLGGGGSGDQRQRQRKRGDPRDRAAARRARDRDAEPAAVRLLRRRGVGAARLGALRRGADGGGARPDRPQPQLRHARLAQRGELRLRRRRLGHRPRRPAGLGRDRGGLRRLLRRRTGCRRGRRPSTAARTTGRSSTGASRRAGCSRGPRG